MKTIEDDSQIKKDSQIAINTNSNNNSNQIETPYNSLNSLNSLDSNDSKINMINEVRKEFPDNYFSLLNRKKDIYINKDDDIAKESPNSVKEIDNSNKINNNKTEPKEKIIKQKYIKNLMRNKKKYKKKKFFCKLWKQNKCCVITLSIISIYAILSIILLIITAIKNKY